MNFQSKIKESDQERTCICNFSNCKKIGRDYMKYESEKTGVTYKPQTEYQLLDQKRKKITQMKKLIAKFDIIINDLYYRLYMWAL